MMTSEHYIRGDDIYPSPADAPSWAWTKVEGVWTEQNRPQPIYTMVYFPPVARHNEADYPASLSREVKKANRLSDMQAYRPIALGTASPTHLHETLALVHYGEVSLGIFRTSKGYTQTAHYRGEGGFVLG